MVETAESFQLIEVRTCLSVCLSVWCLKFSTHISCIFGCWGTVGNILIIEWIYWKNCNRSEEQTDDLFQFLLIDWYHQQDLAESIKVMEFICSEMKTIVCWGAIRRQGRFRSSFVGTPLVSSRVWFWFARTFLSDILVGWLANNRQNLTWFSSWLPLLALLTLGEKKRKKKWIESPKSSLLRKYEICQYLDEVCCL